MAPRDGSNVYHRPPGIDAVTNTTISSVAYNTNVQDVESDLNLPRPIVAGGTGANNAAQAMQNLGGELAGQVITNYDAAVFQAGSFYSAANATNPPVAGHACEGICYVTDSNNLAIEARDVTTGNKWYRTKVAGAWGSWTLDSGAGAFVLKAGDTMTGNLAITSSNPTISLTATSSNPTLVLNKKTATDNNVISALMNGSPRWAFSMGDGTAETGSNAGSNFFLGRYTDAGAPIDAVLGINRANGTATFSANLASNTNILASGSLVTGNGSSGGIIYFNAYGASKYLNYDGSQFVLNGGNLTVNSSVIVSGTLAASGNVFANLAMYFLNSPNWGFTINGGDGSTYLLRNAAVWTTWRASDSALIHTSSAFKPGGGAWADSSDVRIKNVLGDYTSGLDAILALRPVTFTFKGNETHEPPLGDPVHSMDLNNREPYDQLSKEEKAARQDPVVPYANSPHRAAADSQQQFIGLIAQECEGAMPELVSTRTAFIDGEEVTDLRDVDNTPLIFALINAVKTLTARIEALEAK